MKTILIAAALILGLAAPAHAVGVDDTGKLKDGSWSLQFKVAPNFTLDEFGGTTISIKHHLAPRVALRSGISVRLEDSDQLTSFADPDTVVDDRIRTSEARYYTFSLDLLFYPRPLAPVKLFLGAGSFVSAQNLENVQDRDPSSHLNRDRTEYGVRVLGGIEWFFTDSFSLHAEYGLGLSWFTFKDTTVTELEDGASRWISKRDGWSLRDAGVQFGLSVYL